MITKPIRWVCFVCLKVLRRGLIYKITKNAGNQQYIKSIRIKIPHHCGKPMLLAGEPKKDVHGLRFKNCMVDPVDNLRLPSRDAVDEWDGEDG